MPLKAVAFDWGHTLMDERRDEQVPLGTRPVHLMPGVADVLPQLALPLAVWANTRAVGEAALRDWLDRSGLGPFQWVITSVDAGARKARGGGIERDWDGPRAGADPRDALAK